MDCLVGAGLEQRCGPNRRLVLAAPRRLFSAGTQRWALPSFSSCGALASGVTMKREPIHAPSAPNASRAAMPRPLTMPPAPTTRVSVPLHKSTACGTRTSVLTVPVWPPPSPPCAQMMSTPAARQPLTCAGSGFFEASGEDGRRREKTGEDAKGARPQAHVLRRPNHVHHDDPSGVHPLDDPDRWQTHRTDEEIAALKLLLHDPAEHHHFLLPTICALVLRASVWITHITIASSVSAVYDLFVFFAPSPVFGSRRSTPMWRPGSSKALHSRMVLRTPSGESEEQPMVPKPPAFEIACARRWSVDGRRLRAEAAPARTRGPAAPVAVGRAARSLADRCVWVVCGWGRGGPRSASGWAAQGHTAASSGPVVGAMPATIIGASISRSLVRRVSIEECGRARRCSDVAPTPHSLLKPRRAEGCF